MLYTNHKTIVHKNNDETFLLKHLADIKMYMVNTKEVEPIFVKDEAYTFPAYTVPESVTYEDMRNAVGSENVQIRSLNEDSVVIAYTAEKEHDYRFTPEELADKATETMRLLYDVDKMEADLKEHKKKVAAELEEKENRIEKLKMDYTMKYERRIAKCRLEVDSILKKRTYFSAETGEVIHEEPMKASDADYFIKHKLEQVFIPFTNDHEDGKREAEQDIAPM